MENPYVREGLNLGGRTLAQSYAVGNAKLCQNDEFPDSFSSRKRTPSAVDKALTRPYLCGVASVAEALILLVLLAVEPGIAYFPLIDGEPGCFDSTRRVTVS
jgi:hypothetical protein